MNNFYQPLKAMDCKSVDEATKKRRDIITRELLKMKEREENAILRQRAKKKEMKELAVEKLYNEKVRKHRPMTVLPDLANSKRSGNKVISDKTGLVATALPPVKIPRNRKHDSKVLPKVENTGSLLANFWTCRPMQNAHLPENIRQELTTAEISDLRMVFNIFDVKNKGYITVEDLRKATGLLGFSSRTMAVKEMMYETCTDKRGRITFKSFLELIIKLQSGGSDPVEDIVRLFHLLDQEGKGYVTFSDVKNTADELKVGLSNREIGEMLEEADSNGDGRVSIQELTCIVKQTGTFI